MATASRQRDHLGEFAAGFPEATEDNPWGERVVKVRKKIFVFFGTDGAPSGSITVKLAGLALEHALSLPGAAPTAYGLGRSGWVTLPLGGRAPGLAVLEEWIAESYRTVAPKKLGAALDLYLGSGAWGAD